MAESPPGAATDPDLHGKTVWAIDTLSRVYQLFHALPEMSSPDGTPVSAVFGFTRDLLDIVEKKRPDYLFCGMDAEGPTFRHRMFADYKANRAEMPADLVPQIPLIRRLLEVLGIPCLELSGFEADDVLATLATRVVAAGGSCTIATADKDARQLLGPGVQLLNLRTNSALGPEELLAEWAIRPDQVVDFLSLVGDSVDNVPGVPGIGPKIAAELLQKHDTLDAILAHADEVKQAKRRENLIAHADTARAGRELIRLDTAAPISIPWDRGLRHAADADQLAEFLREMGFRSLLAQVVKSKPAAARAPAVAAPKEPRRRSAVPTLFSMDGSDDEPSSAAAGAQGGPVAAAVAMLESVDAATVAEFVPRLRDAAPLVICAAAPADGTSLSPPAGLAVAAGQHAIWVRPELLAACQPLRDLLADPAVPKHGHDLKRQDVALRSAGIMLAGAAFDTLLAAYLLEAGERNLGLVETARRHGVRIDDVIPAGVEAETVERPTTPAAAAVHCHAVRELCRLLPDQLAAVGLGPLFFDVEMPLAAVLADMECLGVRIDPGVLDRLSADYAVRLAALEQEIHALAGRPFAIASPLQVRAVLFDELKLPVVKRTKTGPSTDAEVLEELARSIRCRRNCLSTASTPSSRAPTSTRCPPSSIPPPAMSTPRSIRP